MLVAVDIQTLFLLCLLHFPSPCTPPLSSSFFLQILTTCKKPFHSLLISIFKPYYYFCSSIQRCEQTPVCFFVCFFPLWVQAWGLFCGDGCVYGFVFVCVCVSRRVCVSERERVFQSSLICWQIEKSPPSFHPVIPRPQPNQTPRPNPPACCFCE